MWLAFRAFLLGLGLPLTLVAQGEKSDPRHALSLEVLGPGGIFSLAYAYQFFRDEVVTMTARIGIGTYFDDHVLAGTWPVEISVGGFRHAAVTWETGAAFIPILFSGTGRVDGQLAESGRQAALGFSLRAGMRFLLPQNLALRAAFHPQWLIATPTDYVVKAVFPPARGFVPWGSIGLLWQFK